MINKKAQFFIILLPLIAFVLFTLSLIMYQYSVSFEDRLSEFAAFDKMSNLDLSTQNAIKKIFNDKSSIIITPQGSNILINEQLPFSHATLNNSLDSFKNYLESNFDFIILNTTEVKTSLPLYIKSHDILYYHPTVNSSINNITISTPSINMIKGYDIAMYIGSTFNSVSCTITGSGTKRFTVSIYSTTNSSSYQCQSISSGLSGNSVIINLAGIDTGKSIIINVGNNGNLETIVPATFITNLTTTLYLEDNYYKPEIVLPQGIININYPSFGLSKKGDSKII